MSRLFPQRRRIKVLKQFELLTPEFIIIPTTLFLLASFPSLIKTHLLCLLEFEYFFKLIRKNRSIQPREIEGLERIQDCYLTYDTGRKWSTPEAFIPGAGGLAEFYMRFAPLESIIGAQKRKLFLDSHPYCSIQERNLSEFRGFLIWKTSHKVFEYSTFYCCLRRKVGWKWKRFKQLRHESLVTLWGEAQPAHNGDIISISSLFCLR